MTSAIAVDPRTLPEDEAVQAHRGIAVQLARKWVGRARPLLGYEPPFDEIESHALLGLLKAIRAFDASRGLRFSTFAYTTVNGYLSTSIKKWARFGYKPFGRSNGREKVVDVLAKLPRMVSTSKLLNIQGNQKITLGDTLDVTDPEPVEAPSFGAVFERLPADERRVMTLRYGGRRIEQVARILRLSVLDVRVIESRAIVRIEGGDPSTVPTHDAARIAKAARKRAYYRSYGRNRRGEFNGARKRKRIPYVSDCTRKRRTAS